MLACRQVTAHHVYLHQTMQIYFKTNAIAAVINYIVILFIRNHACGKCQGVKLNFKR